MWYITHHNGISNFKAAYSVMRSFITSTAHQYYSDDHIRRMRWTEHVACMGGDKRCIQGFVGET